MLEHATRSALAALLPLVWRWFEIEDFLQTALTSFVIMFVPGAVLREGRHRAIIKHMVHRAPAVYLAVPWRSQVCRHWATLCSRRSLCYPSEFGSATMFRMAAMAPATSALNLSSAF